MIVNISPQDIQELSHSSMTSFYHAQSDRFEHYKGNIKDIAKALSYGMERTTN